MTALVNTETGELIELLSEHEARRLTGRIQTVAGMVAENLDKLSELIREAEAGQAWRALGYRSWTNYVATEFANVLPRLDRQPRREFVAQLSARGMSSRAIAPVTGTSERQAAYDKAAGVQKCTPEPEAATDDPDDEVVDAELVEGEPAPEPTPPPAPRITGRDGKSYPRPEPATAPRRRPLPDAFLSATYELTKKVTTLTNLATDDRFGANKEKVATANRSDLIRARDALDRLIEQLD